MEQYPLEVKNLSLTYHSRGNLFRKDVFYQAVTDVSFHLEKGEVLALVGESGCGKTTISKIIIRLLKPDAGQVLFDGRDIWSFRESQFRSQRTHIQMITQNPFSGFDPSMKLERQLSEGLREHNTDRNGLSMHGYLTEIIEECGLQEEHLKRYPYELSGGQLQRMAIARAVAVKPRILIADEVISALDVPLQSKILELLMRLKNTFQLGILFITHDLAVVRQIADRIIVMKDGRIVDEGGRDYIFRESGNPFTVRLREAMMDFPY